jgi:SSS family solute:Na+ symporter/sodium/pantothenate symporter
MTTATLTWIGLGLYAAVAAVFAIRGARKSASVASYAVGGRDLPAWVVGLSLSAQLTSVATFVVNPGLVAHYGLAALLGYGAAAGTGITVGLAVLSGPFRETGARVAALTIPQWIGTRWESKGMQVGFALLSAGLLAFATLIVVALALVLSRLLGVPAEAVAAGLLLYVLLAMAMGGATAHAWINAVQALVMIVVALLLVGTAFGQAPPFGGVLSRLAAVDPSLASAVNPGSPFFRNVFEVFFCNLLVGLAIVGQPHILSKALYLADGRQVRRYLAVAIGAGVVFMAVLWVGFAARLALPSLPPIDRVVPAWLASTFGPGLSVVVAIGLLCAGLSTLEGIFLALASILSVDVHPLLPGAKPEEALRFGRLGLVVVAVTCLLLARWQLAHPTGGSVAIFAQYGIYLLFTASSVPLVAGMLLPRARRGAVALSAAVAVAVYVVAGTLKLGALSNNPAVLATWGLLASWAVLGASLLLGRSREA